MQENTEIKENSRRVLMDIPSYPTPEELFKILMSSKGWDYKTNMEKFLLRDRALVSILYVAELRISEALRLTKDQFENKGDFIHVKSILLSKRKKGKVAYRDARLPLEGSRAVFTELIMSYLDTLADGQRLFPWSLETTRYPIKDSFYTTKAGERKQRYAHIMIGTKRAWQIINAFFPNLDPEGKEPKTIETHGITQHWLRAFGEDYLYDAFDHDVYALADEVKVDPRTIDKYIRGRARRYKPA